jgi:putative ABC transport system substrate-binding protein
MKRRVFIGALGCAAVSWPRLLRAQQPGRVYRMAALANSERQAPIIAAFFDELRANGFIEGQNLNLVVNGFGVREDQVARLVTEAVEANPDVILSPEPATRVLQQLTKTIPIVSMTEDMVEAGLVASLARPGGNTTGISLLSHELDGKRLGLLAEIAPGARRMAVFSDSKITPLHHIQGLQAAARSRGIELMVFSLAMPKEIVPAIDAAKAGGAEAANFLATPLTYIPRRTVFERVAQLRLPAIYQWPEMAEEGGLAGYGPRFPEIWRQRARIVVKVLRGTRPADIPVEQPTRFEFVLNLKTAKALGLEIPAGLVLRADKLVE